MLEMWAHKPHTKRPDRYRGRGDDSTRGNINLIGNNHLGGRQNNSNYYQNNNSTSHAHQDINLRDNASFAVTQDGGQFINSNLRNNGSFAVTQGSGQSNNLHSNSILSDASSAATQGGGSRDVDNTPAWMH